MRSGLGRAAAPGGGWRRLGWGPTLAVVAVVVAAGVGLIVSAGEQSVLGEVLVLVLFAAFTNLVVGYSGFVTFGQSLFYGLGAYALALGWYNYHAPFILLLLLAPVLGAAAAFFVGLVALRTRRWFFALITLAFTELMYTIVEQAYSFTQGDTGVFGPMIPSYLSNPTVNYLFILGVDVVCLFVLWRVTVSPFGVVLRAARDNRRRMEALGVSVYWHQLWGFMVAGAGCAVAGALLVVNQQAAYPHLFNWFEAGNPLIASVLGGINSFAGPIVGAVIFEYAKLYLTTNTTQWELVLGVVLVILVLVEPDGLVGLGRRLLGAWQRRRHGREVVAESAPQEPAAPPEELR